MASRIQCVYFLETVDGDRIKIGISSNLRERIKALSIEHKCRLELRGWFPGSCATEFWLHGKFKDESLGREWFTHSRKLEEFMSSIGLLNAYDTGLGQYLESAVTIPVGVPKSRENWSWVTGKLKELKVGQSVCFECPIDMSLPRFRSTILIYAKRILPNLTTRSSGRSIYCFIKDEVGSVRMPA